MAVFKKRNMKAQTRAETLRMKRRRQVEQFTEGQINTGQSDWSNVKDEKKKKENLDWIMYQFLRAAVIQPSDLNRQEFILSQLWMLEAQNWGADKAMLSPRLLEKWMFCTVLLLVVSPVTLNAPWFAAASLQSLPLWSHGLLLYVCVLTWHFPFL